MKVFVSVFTANDGWEKPIVFIGKSKEEIISQIKKELLYDDDNWFNDYKEEIESAVNDGSVGTEFTEFVYSVNNYEKEIDY